MRGRKKLSIFVALLVVLLVIPFAFSLGLVDISKFSLESSPASSAVESASSSTSSVFVVPGKIIKDYLLDPGYQIGDTFQVHVNITDATDLFSWQINMSWNPSILNANRIFAGEFLIRTASESKTAASQLGFVINSTDNAEGYTGMGESILGGVPGINGSGRLVSIEFLVVGYGSSDLTISLSGNLATTLLNSTGGTVTFTKTDGYFSNKLFGDADGDGDVDFADFIVLAGAYGTSSGDPAYDAGADFDWDGDVDFADFIALAGNYGKSA